jgi:diaminohydroxyphosphoribosylaminopyrimidine deaminase/5-amino-6-(5-phosphoribosylamino)uracil reductase
MSLRIQPHAIPEPTSRSRPAAAPEEIAAMRLAIRLAKRGVGTTHPNPLVGAVLLQGGVPIASGYHARAGDAHAEVRALDAAGSLARGATLVVTLEPCAHFGRTPPCTDAILASGVGRVIVGMRDPNPLVDGRGIERLRSAGLEVLVGVLEDDCVALNPPYLKHLRTGLPWVTLKAMLSLDGRIASDSGESRGLGGPAELNIAHRLRAEHDAVVVGLGTVLVDDPLLTVRLTRGKNPLRVVLDTSLRTPKRARIRRGSPEAPVVFATASRDEDLIRSFQADGAAVWVFDPAPDGRVPLRLLLARLASEGCYAVLVEGGATVHTAFLRAGHADRVALGIAPIILGGSVAPSFARDLGRPRIADGIPIEGLRIRRMGRDVWLEGAIAGAEGERV